jgi:hypothetical protein
MRHWEEEVREVLKKIYHELVAIRKELQAINRNLESADDFVLVREPYSTRYAVVRVGREGSLDAK